MSVTVPLWLYLVWILFECCMYCWRTAGLSFPKHQNIEMHTICNHQHCLDVTGDKQALPVLLNLGLPCIGKRR